jgi:hypothetical protein
MRRTQVILLAATILSILGTLSFAYWVLHPLEVQAYTTLEECVQENSCGWFKYSGGDWGQCSSHASNRGYYCCYDIGATYDDEYLHTIYQCCDWLCAFEQIECNESCEYQQSECLGSQPEWLCNQEFAECVDDCWEEYNSCYATCESDLTNVCESEDFGWGFSCEHVADACGDDGALAMTLCDI